MLGLWVFFLFDLKFCIIIGIRESKPFHQTFKSSLSFKIIIIEKVLIEYHL